MGAAPNAHGRNFEKLIFVQEVKFGGITACPGMMASSLTMISRFDTSPARM